MLTIKILERMQKDQLFKRIQTFRQVGIRNFEFTVRMFGYQKLIITTEPTVLNHFEHLKELILLEDLLNYLKDEPKDLKIVLNLQDPNLEYRIKNSVEEWGLKEQIKYTGQIEPMNFTPWDSPNIYYNVENCLPNFYQFKEIKKTHFDVIHYFCRKYKMKNIRIHTKALSSDMLRWAKDSKLNLSVYGIETIQKAEELFDHGITQITTTDIVKPTIYKPI